MSAQEENERKFVCPGLQIGVYVTILSEFYSVFDNDNGTQIPINSCGDTFVRPSVRPSV